MLKNEISTILESSIAENQETRERFLSRLQEGLFTRDENPASHFCVYFLPYNKIKKQVFIVHHKKSGLWISPGGHIDKGESLKSALNREIDEELGVKDFFKETPSPFLLTITPIENSTQPCKYHFDIWYLVETDGSDFNVDPEEFHDTKWMTFAEAEQVVSDKANTKALEILKDW